MQQYFVIADDGKEYGPADVPTLKGWVTENRLSPNTKLKDFYSGQVVEAAGVPGLFQAAPPMQMATQPQSSYVPPPNFAYKPAVDDSMGPLWGIIFRSALALVLFFLFHGIGLIVAAYGMYSAIQAKSNGNKYGIACLVIACLTLAIIGIGWMLRLSGSGI